MKRLKSWRARTDAISFSTSHNVCCRNAIAPLKPRVSIAVENGNTGKRYTAFPVQKSFAKRLAKIRSNPSGRCGPLGSTAPKGKTAVSTSDRAISSDVSKIENIRKPLSRPVWPSPWTKRGDPMVYQFCRLNVRIFKHSRRSKNSVLRNIILVYNMPKKLNVLKRSIQSRYK